MNPPANTCTARSLETSDRPESLGAALCVAHLIAGVAVAFIAIGAMAVFAPGGA